MSTGQDPRPRAYGSVTMAHVAFGALLVAVLAVRVLAVFTENVNWDEFALLHRAELSARSGELAGGGRPGLATLLLLPLAAGCLNALEALVQARLVWTGMVIGSAVAFWFLLRAVLKPTPYRWTAQSLGLGLWLLAPPFLRFSTQVRTDQPAVLFGLVGGLVLVASRRRPAWAAAAGVLLGVGFLFSQKLLYVAGLVGVLAAGQLLIHRDWQPRREMVRAALAGAAFLLVILGYREVMRRISGAPTLLPVTGAMSTFEHYREAVGWRTYVSMLPVLIPQILVVLFLLGVSLDWLRKRERHGAELAVAFGVLAVGVGVLLFHAARFPYFYIVLGLFPATIGALIAVPVLERLPQQIRIAFLALLWIPLVLLAYFQAEGLLRDTQSLQRDSLAFVQRNFSLEDHGFNSRAAFACRQEASPFPVWFHEHVRARFENEEDATETTRWLIREFRDRPVAFMIPPLRWEPYPRELWEFWRTRYVIYHGAVHVPGRRIHGDPGSSGTFEVIVPGEYVWRPSSPDSGPLNVAGLVVDAGSSVMIREPGVYAVSLPAGGEGIFVLALPEPPSPDNSPFYRGW